jgi:hypothetical protein
MSVRIAVLDDYQGVALKMTDWKVAALPAPTQTRRSVLPSDVQVQVFRDHRAILRRN